MNQDEAQVVLLALGGLRWQDDLVPGCSTSEYVGERLNCWYGVLQDKENPDLFDASFDSYAWSQEEEVKAPVLYAGRQAAKDACARHYATGEWS